MVVGVQSVRPAFQIIWAESITFNWNFVGRWIDILSVFHSNIIIPMSSFPQMDWPHSPSLRLWMRSSVSIVKPSQADICWFRSVISASRVCKKSGSSSLRFWNLFNASLTYRYRIVFGLLPLLLSQWRHTHWCSARSLSAISCPFIPRCFENVGYTTSSSPMEWRASSHVNWFCQRVLVSLLVDSRIFFKYWFLHGLSWLRPI